MVMQTKEEIKKEILAYINKWGGVFSNWYAGIAKDPRDRLFKDHNVEYEGAWIFRGCVSSRIARELEVELIELGCDGGSGGGDKETVFIYAYLISDKTKERDE